jgi:hypothetical protein
VALHFYLDSAGTQKVTSLSPDYARNKAKAGQTLELVGELWIKSDNNSLTYEDIQVWADGDNEGASVSGEIEVKYSLDNVAYFNILSIPNQDFITPIKIYRKVIAPSIQEAFQRTDIKPKIKYASFTK